MSKICVMFDISSSSELQKLVGIEKHETKQMKSCHVLGLDITLLNLTIMFSS
jgi:hypothetical protein